MSDTKPEDQPAPNKETAASPQTEPVENANAGEKTKKQCPTSGICRRGLHLPLILSLIAILLASYSFYTTQCSSFTRNMDKRVGDLSSQVAVISERLSNLDEGIESDKQALIQAGLQKTLLNIQDIAKLTKGEMQAKITEIEGILLGMTSPDDKVKKEQETTSVEKPSTEISATESASQEENTPVVAEEPSSPSSTLEPPAAEQTPSSSQPDPVTDNEPALKTGANAENPVTSASEF
ncbi:MAG: hypothetical protein ACE5DY_05200 [Mariprofundaceae bacterium]